VLLVVDVVGNGVQVGIETNFLVRLNLTCLLGICWRGTGCAASLS
jgi:hypothetical protein